MLPVVGVASRHVVALQKRADVVDFEERDRSLRLPVGVEDLPDVSVAPGPVGVAPAVLPAVGDDHELEHVVVQRQGHLVERLDVLVRMDHGSQDLSDHVLNQLRSWGIHPSVGFLEEPETNRVVERWNRTLTEQAVYGRVFRHFADVRAAVAEFVERYNQCWRLKKLAYRTPLEAREEYELRHAA